MLPGRTLDIKQKYDRPPPDLFDFTVLLLGIHVQMIQNAQQSSGVENGLGVNQSVQLLSPYNAGYFRETESLSVQLKIDEFLLSLSNTHYTLLNTGSTQGASKTY